MIRPDVISGVVPVVVRVRTGALLAACAAALVACGGAAPLAPELALGTAPAGQRPVALPAFPPGGIGAGPQWPHACDLLTDDEVRAVLPQATGIARAGAADTIDHALLADLGVGDPAAPDIAVPERSCTLAVGLPAVDDTGAAARVSGTIEVRVTMVGGADTVGYFWSPFQSQPLPGPVDDRCVEEFPDHRPDPSIGTFGCRADAIAVTLTTGLPIPDGWHLRLAGDPADTDAAVVGQWFRERVGPALVGVVARRLP